MNARHSSSLAISVVESCFESASPCFSVSSSASCCTDMALQIFGPMSRATSSASPSKLTCSRTWARRASKKRSLTVASLLALLFFVGFGGDDSISLGSHF